MKLWLEIFYSSLRTATKQRQTKAKDTKKKWTTIIRLYNELPGSAYFSTFGVVTF